ncbi:TonB-dependent receptor [Aestuariicella hydrocarbonica]|uniref:TonB-dependent receptor n=2 Tax=Pseudomaricurvus hydrocarbonicus TaxID=1470433 RepID=A0A9E5JRN3_9GAMM|nr:TonB-dependent receptor [Aestuariicella hydrocarbonica]
MLIYKRNLLMYKRHLLASALVLTQLPVFADALPTVSVEESIWPFAVHHTATTADIHAADTASALQALAGAAVNRNGGLTGIAQYRGSSGDRVNVTIDGASIGSGGPNAMDTPLSYIPASQLASLAIVRGTASVSEGQETLGGHIAATSYQGEFTDSAAADLNGRIHTNWHSQNRGSSSSLQIIGANQNYKAGFSGSYDHAEDSIFAGGNIDSTRYERRRHDVFYGYRQQDTEVNIKLGQNNTGDSGTPALPMDITAIDSDLASVDASTQAFDMLLSWHSSYSDIDHTMDNFSLRPQPVMGPRQTNATGRQVAHKLMATRTLDNSLIRIGTDYSDTTHHALLTNPDMALFEIQNFNHAERTISGVFAEWQQSRGALSWELGARFNRVEMAAGEVSAFLGAGVSGMMDMGMMTTMANMLAMAFNNSKRHLTDHNRDLVLKMAYQLSDTLSVNASLSHKQRAPSYQERYLWLPLQATGGLADGYTYLGNLDLESETARELNLGLDYRTEDGYLSLQTFYREVDDYIQGTLYQASGNMMIDNAVAMFAAMMSSGNPALQYNNINARLYGGELTYGLQLNPHWSLSGSLNYIRGQRADSDDDLYRIAPLNHRIALNYQQDQWSVRLVSEMFDQQPHVSDYNREAKTSGYGVLHLSASYDLSDALQLRAGIDNLADKRYRDHLAGYNRVRGNEDIAVGERLYGTGRSAILGLTYHW